MRIRKNSGAQNEKIRPFRPDRLIRLKRGEDSSPKGNPYDVGTKADDRIKADVVKRGAAAHDAVYEIGWTDHNDHGENSA